jgi:DNA-binding NarL/FixJ family response regulator
MNTTKKYNFISADDHSIVTQGMSFILKDLYNGATVYQIESFSEIIKVLNSTTIDLLILDINFPDGSSLNLLPTLKKIQPDLKILIFSGYDEDIYAVRYLSAGANGFLSKISSEEEIKNAITAVMNTGKYLSKKIQEKIMDSYIFKKPANPLEQLSNRELEIAKLIVEGYGNIEICTTLHLQKSTVSTYKNRIFEKLDVDNLADFIQVFNLYNNGEKL